MRFLSLLSFLTISTLGCGDAGPHPGDGGAGDGGSSCLPSCPGTRAYDAVSYALHGHFDWTQRLLVATEDLTLTLTDGAAAGVVELDSAVDVKRVYAGERELPFAADLPNRTLRVDLTALSAPFTFHIDYSAAPSSALVARAGRDGDPVDARVVYTDSEPDRGAGWLVANHHPADRAQFSVELTVAADEDLVSNGHRAADRVDGAARTVTYQISDPIPTYLMAFAAGQLEHRDRVRSRSVSGAADLPLSVWFRRGLLIDADANLDVLVDCFNTFESKLGAYPFERYSLVLLPDFPGGMENATITFQSETSGQGRGSFELTSHELSHHWFGDWVTMHDFDDVWVKEGMATLLEVEADRARRDRAGLGRLFGTDWYFSPDDAVIDPTLHGSDKYTSGPYARAAWMITQIRASVGEDAFWASLRAVLHDHALGTIDGPAFVRAFAPALAEAKIRKIIATLGSKPVPGLDIASTTGSDGTTSLSLTLRDPSQALVVAPELRVIDAAGTVGPPVELAAGVKATLDVPPGGYLASDERDVHPNWSDSWDVDSNLFWSAVAPLYLPTAAPAQATLAVRSAAQQERAANAASPEPDRFAALFDGLDSTAARDALLSSGCGSLSFVAGQPTPPTPNPWVAVLGPIVAQAVPSYGGFAFARCGTDVGTTYLGSELATLAAAVDAKNAGRLVFVSSFDFGVATSFDTFAKLATTAPSLQLREWAIRRLAAQANPSGDYSKLSPADRTAWAAFFEARLAETTSQTHLSYVWTGIKGLADAAALPMVAAKLHAIPVSELRQRLIICDAFHFAAPADFASFQAALQPWATLSMGAQQVLAMPAACDAQMFRAAATTQPGRYNAVGLPLDRPDAHVGERRSARLDAR